MNTSEFLYWCRSLGICVAVNGDRLHVEAPAGRVTPAISARLKADKQSIINLLSTGKTQSVDQATPFDKAAKPDKPAKPIEVSGSEAGCSGLSGYAGFPVPNFDQATIEAYEERAAIIEYEGGLEREAAEVLAKGLSGGSVVESWAVIEPEGRILVDSNFETAADAWRTGLGWPDHAEIEDAKKRGYQVERVSIVRDIKQP